MCVDIIWGCNTCFCEDKMQSSCFQDIMNNVLYLANVDLPLTYPDLRRNKYFSIFIIIGSFYVTKAHGLAETGEVISSVTHLYPPATLPWPVMRSADNGGKSKDNLEAGIESALGSVSLSSEGRKWN